MTVARGSKIAVPLNVERIAGFDGRGAVTSPAATTGTKVNLKIKVKANAPTGPQEFTFTGRDSDGRTRSATLRLVVQ